MHLLFSHACVLLSSQLCSFVFHALYVFLAADMIMLDSTFVAEVHIYGAMMDCYATPAFFIQGIYKVQGFMHTRK